MHQDVPLSDSNFTRLDFNVTERRKSTEDVLTLIQEMFVEIREIRDEGRAMRKDLQQHIADEAVMVNHAFPGGDVDGHRMAHAAWIKRAEAQAKFWEDMKSSVAKWGMFGVLGFLLAASIHQIADRLIK